MTRFQNGSLKRVMRKQGESWMLRYRKRRALDGRWVEATPITVVSDTYLTATVPPGATTGFVTVTTPSGTLTSNQEFRVRP